MEPKYSTKKSKILGTRLTDRISKNRLYGKCGSIPLSRAINERKVVMVRARCADEG
jgi:hypothetical protein